MIPTEIVDHILKFLVSDHDFTTLETCSEVFPEIVDRHLYVQIALSSPFPPSPTTDIQAGFYVVDPTKFSRILIDRPHVGKCVLRVSIHLADVSHPDETPLLPVISFILSNLSQIDSIWFLADPSISWPAMGPEFCTAFLNIVRLRPLKHAGMLGMHEFYLESFDGCKNLRDLSLSCDKFMDGEGVSESSLSRLRSLQIRSDTDLTRIISWLKSNTLHTLILHVHKETQIPQFQLLLKACPRKLVSLTLNLHPICRSDFAVPVFPQTRLSLRAITIEFGIVVESQMRTSPLIFLQSFLGSIQKKSSRPSIRLTLNFQLVLFPGFVVPLLSLDWSILAFVLCLPIFCHPIELTVGIISRRAIPHNDVILSFKRNPDINRLLWERKLKLEIYNSD